MSDALRSLWRTYHAEHARACAEWRERGYPHGFDLPALPEELRGLTCGAKTRAGTPCKIKDLYRNGRCKLHGGLSTGPKTEAGKEWSRINGRKGGRRKAEGSTEPKKGAKAGRRT